MRNSERLFECESCGAIVQGWHAAHWYDRWHDEDCPDKTQVVEVTDTEEESENVRVFHVDSV